MKYTIDPVSFKVMTWPKILSIGLKVSKLQPPLRGVLMHKLPKFKPKVPRSTWLMKVLSGLVRWPTTNDKQ